MHAFRHILLGLMLSILAIAPNALAAGANKSPASSTATTEPPDRLPEKGPLPTMPGAAAGVNVATPVLSLRARMRQYETQFRIIERRYFGRRAVAELRARGFEELAEFTDPASFIPMVERFGDADDGIVLWMLDHFAGLGEHGQAILAHLAITHERPAIRHEATMRIVTPASPAVRSILDSALRSNDNTIVTNAAMLAGAHNILEAIPLLIFGQAAAAPTGGGDGDLAWIAIETQRAYVQGANPVAGNAAGAFAPVIGTVSEGSVLRIQDAVVITYRTTVHRVLVSMTTADWGQSTAAFGYDLDTWWTWYNDVYVPFKAEQAALDAMTDDVSP